MVDNFNEKADFIWSIADLLRGDYKQSEYQKVILPLTVLRRLDCVTQRNKQEVLERNEQLQKQGIENVAPALKKTSGEKVYNTSEYTFESLCNDPDQIASNLQYYINAYDEETKEIFDKFDFDHQIQRLGEADLLFQVIEEFKQIDLHPDNVPNEEMGYIYEELVRKFNELSNETAGEHFTPREVIELMVNLIFDEDDEVLTEEGAVRTVYDPACGTGGMLSVAENHVRSFNQEANLHVFGQELNPESYAVCNSDMLIKGQEPENIAYGNSFTNDGFPERKFDYMLSNPPFGVSWKKVKDQIETEHKEQGFAGRFGAGTPRQGDGALLFLQHMIGKMKPVEEGGSRIGIVFNGSPLFIGGPNSGESAIRRWIIENDWLEAVVGLPENLFYNTPIHTYIWVLSNDKPTHREGKVQLIDARDLYDEMDDNLGEKRHKLSDNHIDKITQIFGNLETNGRSKILSNSQLGYRRIVIDQPLRMSFQATEERIETLDDERAFTNRDEITQEEIKEALKSLDSDKRWIDRDDFIDEVELAFNMRGVDVRNSVYNAIERALGKRNPDAKVVTNSNGDPEHDTKKREKEKIPLGTDPFEYFEEEIEPYAPEAWVNESSKYHDDDDGRLGIVGYEINFLEQFLSYEPGQSLGEIEQEVSELEDQITDQISALSGRRENIITQVLGDHFGQKSGPEWLGKIPKHWESSPLKYNISMESGSTPEKAEDSYWGGSIPWFSPKDMKSELLSDSQDHITEAAIKEENLTQIQPQTILVVVRGMILDHTFPVGLTQDPATFNQDMKALTPNENLLPEYLLHLLQGLSPVILAMVKESAHGTKRLETEDLKSIEIPIPPISEQKEIVREIDSRTDEIESLKEQLQDLHSVLEKQSQELVTSAVTGQATNK